MKYRIKKFDDLSSIELYKIIESRVNIFVVEQECPYPECDNKDQFAHHLYLKDKNKIAAYCRILPAGISYPEASIGRVLVKKDYRRKNIGTKLMKRAISFIKDNFKQNKIKISAQEYALDFYQQLNFKIVSEKYLEDGIPHYEMLLKLK